MNGKYKQGWKKYFIQGSRFSICGFLRFNEHGEVHMLSTVDSTNKWLKL